MALFSEYVEPAISERLSQTNGEMLFDADSKTWYAFYNDSASLHITLKVADALQQRKIVINGLELWIDVKGKKNKTTGILYPAGSEEKNSTDFQPGRGLPPQRPDTSLHNSRDALEAMLKKKTQMQIRGFAKSYNGLYEITSATGPHVSLYFIKDTLCYQADIPFGMFAKPVTPNSTISIGIIEKGMLPFDMGNDMGGGGPGGDGGPPPGGGGGGMPPGPPPGGMPPDGDNMQAIFQNNVIWYKLALH